jgi:hypothetical protein
MKSEVIVSWSSVLAAFKLKKELPSIEEMDLWK